MPFNGSGVFTRLYSWANDAAASIKIRADRMDNEMNGMATGLSQCLTKDGQTTVTANLPMSGFRHTGVSNATSRNQYGSYAQVMDGKGLPTVSGTGNAIVLSYSVTHTAYVAGMEICFVATAANTSAVTINVDGLGVINLTKNGTAPLVTGDIIIGELILCKYDGTRFQVERNIPLADGDKGDITVSASGATWVIDNDAVTELKIANNAVTVNKILDGAVTFAKIATASIASVAEMTSGAASKLVSASNLSTFSTFRGGANVVPNSAVTFDLSTSIPSWVNRVRCVANQISTNGTSDLVIRIGNGAFVATGYVGGTASGGLQSNSTSTGSRTDGFPVATTGIVAATSLINIEFELIRLTGNTWQISGRMFLTNGTLGAWVFSGSLVLGSALDRVRIATVNATDTFDNGVGSATVWWD